MAEWLGNGLQNHAQQFDSAWHLDLLVKYEWSPRERRRLIFLYKAFSQEHFPVYLGFLVQREGVSPG